VYLPACYRLWEGEHAGGATKADGGPFDDSPPQVIYFNGLPGFICKVEVNLSIFTGHADMHLTLWRVVLGPGLQCADGGL